MVEYEREAVIEGVTEMTKAREELTTETRQ